jgi:Tfp pilus assembly protein FimT
MPRNNCRGTTLLELVIAAVVLGVIVTMAGPQFGDTIQKLKFKSKSRDVVSDIRLVRSDAVSQRTQFGIHFDYEQNGYVLFKDLVNPGLYQYDTGDSVLKTISWGQEASLYYTSFDPTTIIFKPDGSASVSGDVIVADATDVHRARVNVLAATGRVKLTYEPGESETSQSN